MAHLRIIWPLQAPFFAMYSSVSHGPVYLGSSTLGLTWLYRWTVFTLYGPATPHLRLLICKSILGCFVRFHNSSFVIWSGQKIFSILLRHLLVNTCSLAVIRFYIHSILTNISFTYIFMWVRKLDSNSLRKTKNWSGRNEVTETSGRLHPLWAQNKWLHTPRTTDYRHTRQDRWIQTELAFTLAKNTTKPNPFEIIPLQTTRKTDEAVARAAVTLETERTKGSNPWYLWWWWWWVFFSRSHSRRVGLPLLFYWRCEIWFALYMSLSARSCLVRRMIPGPFVCGPWFQLPYQLCYR